MVEEREVLVKGRDWFGRRGRCVGGYKSVGNGADGFGGLLFFDTLSFGLRIIFSADVGRGSRVAVRLTHLVRQSTGSPHTFGIFPRLRVGNRNWVQMDNFGRTVRYCWGNKELIWWVIWFKVADVNSRYAFARRSF